MRMQGYDWLKTSDLITVTRTKKIAQLKFYETE